jgi:hypothetical protein
MVGRTTQEVIFMLVDEPLPHENPANLPLMLHRLSTNMCHARRQFVLVAGRSALTAMNSPDLDLLLALFQEMGVVVGPDKLLI